VPFFLIVGWTGPAYYVTALSVGAVVCIAASNGGTTSQDLKTGYLIGSTPRSQQIAILVGALASALVLGPILLRLNESATVYVPRVEMVDGKSQENFSETLHFDVSGRTERAALVGPQAKDDPKSYLAIDKVDDEGGQPGRYLVSDDGTPIYYVDPGINGTHSVRPMAVK